MDLLQGCVIFVNRQFYFFVKRSAGSAPWFTLQSVCDGCAHRKWKRDYFHGIHDRWGLTETTHDDNCVCEILAPHYDNSHCDFVRYIQKRHTPMTVHGPSCIQTTHVWLSPSLRSVLSVPNTVSFIVLLRNRCSHEPAARVKDLHHPGAGMG